MTLKRKTKSAGIAVRERAFKARPDSRDAPGGEPLLGLQKCVAADKTLQRLFAAARSTWIVAPNREPEGSPSASGAKKHGEFDDDPATVKATLARILGESHSDATDFASSGQRRRAVRRKIERLRDFASAR